MAKRRNTTALQKAAAARPVQPQPQFSLTTVEGSSFIMVPKRWCATGTALVVPLLFVVIVLALGLRTATQRLAVNDVEIAQAGEAYQATIQHLEEWLVELRGAAREIQQNAALAQGAFRRGQQQRHEVLTAASAENANLRRSLDGLRAEFELVRVAANGRR